MQTVEALSCVLIFMFHLTIFTSTGVSFQVGAKRAMVRVS